MRHKFTVDTIIIKTLNQKYDLLVKPNCKKKQKKKNMTSIFWACCIFLIISQRASFPPPSPPSSPEIFWLYSGWRRSTGSPLSPSWPASLYMQQCPQRLAPKSGPCPLLFFCLRPPDRRRQTWCGLPLPPAVPADTFPWLLLGSRLKEQNSQYVITVIVLYDTFAVAFKTFCHGFKKSSASQFKCFENRKLTEQFSAFFFYCREKDTYMTVKTATQTQYRQFKHGTKSYTMWTVQEKLLNMIKQPFQQTKVCSVKSLFVSPNQKSQHPFNRKGCRPQGVSIYNICTHSYQFSIF